ncbi:hypothetical protein [Sporolactobacillus terrae]|uniref:hypothetical protein n=1 Tax=Sporolactobacillus terrae TaxID=269673 RepID=UPI0004913990|nr:hypothetical protein [Sporolactobacillus terrae]
MFKKREDYEFETVDNLIVFDEENRMSDIAQITQVTADAVIVDGAYRVPLADCVVTTGKEGRNFFYNAPAESIRETKRLAQLEKNMVLEQITAYKPPVLPTGMDWTKALLFVLVFVAFIVVGLTSCAGGK